jgi:CheY-like chemotaxis protein
LARRILLADDSVTAQNMGRRILSDAGYEVVTVNNGSAALKKIAEQKPDLIVLDVYMPGYGGLEVCQRVKENRETARIPVLLTVGKLEPFKPDEARRVRADAFIVKPFEASELLTALTKLEDKIVPQGLQKPGRFAKALAAVEQSASEQGDSFGDAETGWKDRLIIPPPSAKPAEAETPQLTSTAIRELWNDRESKPVEPKGFERPIPAGLPADITPEEIAAITAAAASFGSKPEESSAHPETAAKAEIEESKPAARADSVAEATPATLASASETVVEEAKPTAAEVAPIAEAVAASEATKTDDSPVAEAPAMASSAAATDSEEKTSPEAGSPDPAKPWTQDAEVLAAIASLAPTNGHAFDSGGPAESDANAARQTAEIPAMVPAAVASAGVTAEGIIGPRWIAEAISVPEDESTFILEREMEKAYAAFAAADAGRSYVAAAAVAVGPSTTVESKPPEAVVAVASFSEPAPAPEAGIAVQAQASSAVPVAKEEAAYAAAASTSAVSESTPAAELTSQTVVAPQSPESTPPAPEPGANQREAELAAAWQNWKHIRESIVGSQLTAQIAEAAAGELKEIRGEEPASISTEETGAAAETESDEPSNAARESTAIASIVDSVLAELKPKLVEEIAKKMHTDKKDKEKEKDKKKKK